MRALKQIPHQGKLEVVIRDVLVLFREYLCCQVVFAVAFFPLLDLTVRFFVWVSFIFVLHSLPAGKNNQHKFISTDFVLWQKLTQH